MAVKELEAVDVAEVLANASKFVQEYDGSIKFLEKLLAKVKGLRHDVIQLVNARDNYERLNRAADINLAQKNREADTRMANVDAGHRAIVDRLTKKELEAQNLKAELDKKQLVLDAERAKYELLNADMERRLTGISQISAKHRQ